MQEPGLSTGLTVRVRLLFTMLALTTSVLLAAGATGFLLERLSIERTAVVELDREASGFIELARTMTDPRTGQPISSTSMLLRVAIEQRVLGPDDGVLGIVNGGIEWVAPDVATLRLENDPALVAVVLAAANAPTTTQGRYRDATHDLAYLVIPVRGQTAANSGALVRAIDLVPKYQALESTYRLYAAAAIVIGVLAAGVAWAIMGRLLAPIARLRETAESISPDDLSRRLEVSGHDDLSALTVTINRMLDRIEGLVEGQRQLADDVGHELRTPLTILRGHLELLDPADEAQVRQTRSLALEEIDRMSRLIEDLLLLASTERADFVVPTACDLAELTDETFALICRIDERPWRLVELAEAELVVDPQRLRQAWLQLVDNAVKYSPPGSPIAIGSRIDGGEAWLWVADQGPGIPDEERARILEREVRGANALSSGRIGQGLGLSIVIKIVGSHHGRLDIAAGADGGSIISLVLPVPDPEGGPHDADSDR
ncbi:MAG: ATP-binding protein [Propionibacteriales bacterium]|nr:ATP-binding protein [Propionibacteriales bacterium]